MTFAKIPEARPAQASAWRRGLAVVAVTAVAFASMHAAGVSFQGVEKKHHHAHLGESTKQGGGVASGQYLGSICCTKDQDEIAKCHAPRNCFGGPETPGDGDKCGACYTEPEDKDDGGMVPAYQGQNVLGEPLAGGDDDDDDEDEDEEQKINEHGCYEGSKGWCENLEHSHMSACECKEDCDGDLNLWSDDHKCDKNGGLTLEAQDSKVDELKQEKARVEAALEDAIEDQAVQQHEADQRGDSSDQWLAAKRAEKSGKQKINEYGCYEGSKGWCENREHGHMSACECKEDCGGDSNVWSDNTDKCAV